MWLSNGGGVGGGGGHENGHLRNSSLEKKWVYYLNEERNAEKKQGYAMTG